VSNSWTAPPIRSISAPAASTQLPDNLPGADLKKWPYPWGALGSRTFPPTAPRKLRPHEQEALEREQGEDEYWSAANAAERRKFLATFGIGVEAPAAAAAAEGQATEAEGAEATAPEAGASDAAAPTTIDAEAKRVDTEPAAPQQ